jgi:hypothetical protein
VKHLLSRAQTFVSNVEVKRMERQKERRETDRARKVAMKKGKNIRKGDREKMIEKGNRKIN